MLTKGYGDCLWPGIVAPGVAPQLIVIVMVLGLVGFAVAQDLDSPTSGVAVDQQQQGAGGGSVFDMIMARIQQGEADTLNRVFAGSWRGRYWEIWAWESSYTNANSFAMWGRFAGWDLTDAAATYEQQMEQLTAAEQAAAREAAGTAHRRIVSAGLN